MCVELFTKVSFTKVETYTENDRIYVVSESNASEGCNGQQKKEGVDTSVEKRGGQC
jgi:hypothetical protein